MDRFQLIVLHVLAQLYAAFPLTAALDSGTLPFDKSDSIGTLTWMLQSKWIMGPLNTSSGLRISSATLTENTLRVLSRPEIYERTKASLGSLAVKHPSDPIFAGLLLRRMLADNPTTPPSPGASPWAWAISGSALIFAVVVATVIVVAKLAG